MILLDSCEEKRNQLNTSSRLDMVQEKNCHLDSKMLLGKQWLLYCLQYNTILLDTLCKKISSMLPWLPKMFLQDMPLYSCLNFLMDSNFLLDKQEPILCLSHTSYPMDMSTLQSCHSHMLSLENMQASMNCLLDRIHLLDIALENCSLVDNSFLLCKLEQCLLLANNSILQDTTLGIHFLLHTRCLQGMPTLMMWLVDSKILLDMFERLLLPMHTTNLLDTLRANCCVEDRRNPLDKLLQLHFLLDNRILLDMSDKLPHLTHLPHSKMYLLDSTLGRNFLSDNMHQMDMGLLPLSLLGNNFLLDMCFLLNSSSLMDILDQLYSFAH